MSVKLTYYDEVTPADYEPKGFGADNTTEDPMPSGAYRLSLGEVKTGFHSIRLKMASRHQGAEDSYVNDNYLAESQSQSQSQQLSGEAPVESGEEGSQSQSQGSEKQHSQDMEDQQQQDTQMSEKSPSSSQPDSPASTVSLNVKVEESSSSLASVVDCVCQNYSRDHLMLECSTCSTLSHAICYRVLSEEEMPAQHTCWTCSKENPGLTCTDPRMDKFKGKEALAAPTCLFRRVLVLLWGFEEDHITTNIIRSTLDLSKEEFSNLKKGLLAQKVVTESSGNFVIDREALKDAMKRYLGIRSKTSKSNSVTSASTNSSQRTTSKRKEEMMVERGEARDAGLESKKKKKSRTGDLQF